MFDTWEYHRMLLDTYPFAPADHGTDEILKARGADGWELMAVSSGIAYFKRRLVTGTVAVPAKPSSTYLDRLETTVEDAKRALGSEYMGATVTVSLVTLIGAIADARTLGSAYQQVKNQAEGKT